MTQAMKRTLSASIMRNRKQAQFDNDKDSFT